MLPCLYCLLMKLLIYRCFSILFYFILVEIENVLCWKLNRFDFVRWERSRGYRDDVLSCYDKEKKKRPIIYFNILTSGKGAFDVIYISR